MGNIGTIAIVLILVVICLFAVRGYIKKLKNGCCGGASDSVKKIKTEDTDESHYPYCAKVGVDGMSCSKCKVRVENAFNALDGVWAEVNLKTNSANVRMKKQLSEEEIRKAVLGAGYAVTEVTFSPA